MKRMKTNVVLAGMMAFALTVHAEQTTPPADPAFTNPDAVSEQNKQVLDSQDNPAIAETSKEEALYAALRNEQDDESGTQLAMAETVEVAVQSTEPATYGSGASTVEEATEVTETIVDSEEATVVIPLIVMDEVPLMDAIRNLARQAMINYMVDPRVPYGQVGEDGQVTPQPILSIRWENVTAEQALVAVLNNYNLQISEDPKAKIYRVTVKDPAAPDPLVTKIIQLKYASPSNVVTAVQSAFVDKRS